MSLAYPVAAKYTVSVGCFASITPNEVEAWNGTAGCASSAISVSSPAAIVTVADAESSSPSAETYPTEYLPGARPAASHVPFVETSAFR